VLELDLAEGIIEQPPRDPLSAAIARRRIVLRDLVDGLRRAAGDGRVHALVARVGTGRVGLSTAQEIRDAVWAFRASGKPAIAWSESFNEFGPATVPYYLATAFGEIWLQPSGAVGLTGVGLRAVFLRETLERAGVAVELGRRHEYKSAPETFTETGFTAAHREASERLVGSMFEQIAAGIGAARGLAPERVGELADAGPLLAAEALEAGLVDRLGYRDEVYGEIADRVGEHRPLLVARYSRRKARPSAVERATRLVRRRRPVLALVQAVGGVRLGRSGRGPLSGSAMGSDSVTSALRAATADPDVRAIVFRIDSPGGSYVASDAIWRQVAQCREAGTPVIVSMGDVAASGGYFIAMGADLIVAEPGTITGSIGVFGGKAVIAGLLDRLRVGHDGVASGDRAFMFSPRRGFTDAERQRLEAWLDHVYEDFVAKAAEGRRMSREQVHAVAKGRVWTGADARERGLVDELGGLHAAVQRARERAGLPADREPEIRAYPRLSTLDRVRAPRSTDDPSYAAAVLRQEAWGPLAGLSTRLGLPPDGPLVLPGDLSPA
jgi:protease-4